MDTKIFGALYILSGSTVFANPCEINVTSSTSIGDRSCRDVTPSTKDLTSDDVGEDAFLASHTVFTILVVLVVVLLPMTGLIRICWMKKLQKQRNRAANEVRRIVDQRLAEQRERPDIYTIDIEMFFKPPSYEESIANPYSGSPPPYDQRPSSSKQVDEQVQLDTSRPTSETPYQPVPTASDAERVTSQNV